MKKILVLFLSLITLFSLVACAGGEEGGDDADNGKPRYETEYTFDETHHWREQINGYGKTEYEEHENEQGRCECGKYYDCTHMLDFRKIKLGNVEGYMVTGYKDEDYFGANLYLHYDVPTHYQGEDDEEPLPVISLGPGAFSVGTVNAVNYNDVPIFSVKLHEGLLEIQDWCFKGSEITELIIPDSVTNEYHTVWGGNQYGIIYNICGGCMYLKRFVMGAGLKVLGAYNFGNSVEEVVIGSSVEVINFRAFYEIYNLKYLVIPASVKFIPEGSVSGGSYGNVPVVSLLPTSVHIPIYLEITREEYNALVVPLRDRDVEGNILNPISEGFVEGWQSYNDLYFKGEWEYGEDGTPRLI